jgi:hypothetical protein
LEINIEMAGSLRGALAWKIYLGVQVIDTNQRSIGIKNPILEGLQNLLKPNGFLMADKDRNGLEVWMDENGIRRK